jgi:hypothetical protein
MPGAAAVEMLYDKTCNRKRFIDVLQKNLHLHREFQKIFNKQKKQAPLASSCVNNKTRLLSALSRPLGG